MVVEQRLRRHVRRSCRARNVPPESPAAPDRRLTRLSLMSLSPISWPAAAHEGIQKSRSTTSPPLGVPISGISRSTAGLGTPWTEPSTNSTCRLFLCTQSCGPKMSERPEIHARPWALVISTARPVWLVPSVHFDSGAPASPDCRHSYAPPSRWAVAASRPRSGTGRLSGAACPRPSSAATHSGRNGRRSRAARRPVRAAARWRPATSCSSRTRETSRSNQGIPVRR